MGILDILQGNPGAASPYGALYPSPLSGADPQTLAAIYAAAGMSPPQIDPFGDPSKSSVAAPGAPAAPGGFGANAAPFSFGGPGSNVVSPSQIAAPAPTPIPQPRPDMAAAPAGAPTDVSSANATPQASPIAVGNYQMPRVGAADDFEPDDATPANAAPTAGGTPPGIPARAPFSFGGAASDVGDRLSLAGKGFLGNMSAGPVGALFGGLGALVSGKPTDAATIARQSGTATARALISKGSTPEEAVAAAQNPELMKALIGQYYGKEKYSVVQTGEDGNGQKQFSVFNTQTGERNPIAVPSDANERGGTVMGPNGKPIAIPPGVNRKEFVKRVSEASADAATGKQTEAQAKASSFATRMEQAETLMPQLQNQGLSLAGAAKSAVPGGNLVQSADYQKYAQAKSAFITALLRQESGAAINRSEFDRYEKEMFPQPGDDASVVTQKAGMRAAAITQMRRAAGPGYQPSVASGPAAGLPAGWSVKVN